MKIVKKSFLFGTTIVLSVTVAAFTFSWDLTSSEVVDPIATEASFVSTPPIQGVIPADTSKLVEASKNTISYSDPSLAGMPTKYVEGTVEVVAAELSVAGHENAERYYVVTSDGSAVPISFSTPPDHLTSNTAFSGQITDSDIVASANMVLPASAIVPTKHRFYVGLISTTDAPRTSTVADAETIASAAKSFWLRESNGFIPDIEIDVREYSLAATCDLPERLLYGSSQSSLSDQTAIAFGFSSYADSQTDPEYKNHIISYLPSGCYGKTHSGTYGGLAVVGSDLTNGGWVTLLDSDGYLNISTSSPHKNNDWILTHELGHNFSLGHGDSLHGSVFSADGEYHNSYNVMGSELSPVPALPAIYRDFLSVSDQNELTTLSIDYSINTTETLSPVSLNSPRSVKIIDNKADKVYYVEYRNGAGIDSDAYYLPSLKRGNYCFGTGVNISTIALGNHAGLITKHDSNNNCWRSNFVVGEEIDIDGLLVKVNAISTTSATISIKKTLPKIANPVFAPMLKPFWTRLSSEVKKINVTTGEELSTPVPAGSVILLSSEIPYNNDTCLRTRDDAEQDLPLCIFYSDLGSL